MQKPKTHFEQVPVAQILRRVIKRDGNEPRKKHESISTNVIVERPASKTEPYSVVR